METWEAEYLKLQNGSDIRGVAIEGVQGETVNLTEEIVIQIAMAFADFLSQKLGKSLNKLKIGVGNDSRLSTNIMKNGVIKGMLAKECQIFDCGLTSTPSMFMSTVLDGFHYDGSIMITASHLPFNRNGLKFFTEAGGLEHDDIELILKNAAKGSNIPFSNEENEGNYADLVQAYSTHLKDIIKEDVNAKDYEQPLEGLHIVVDASNGVSGYFTKVLEDLGACTKGSICLEPDGSFPNHIPNPENQEAMEAIRGATLAAKADMGIIFDTDGDRAAVVFSDGEEVNKNGIIALMAAILAEKYPNTTVVTDSVTSNYLTEFLEGKLKMKHHRFQRGYKNVINEAIRLNKEGIETHLAIETSGHGAVKENYFLDDGAYLCVMAICMLAKCKKQGEKIENLIKDLKKPAESRELRLKIGVSDFREYGEQVLKDFKVFAERTEGFEIVSPNYEGVRVDIDDSEVKGWMLIRMSLHDPVMPINIEADCEGGTERIISKIQLFFEQYDALSKS